MTTAKPTRKPRPTRTITPEKWDEVERAWTNGKFATIADLSAHYKIPENSLKNRFDLRGLKRGGAIEEYNRKVQRELEKRAAEDAKLVADRIAETREDHYKMAMGIGKLTWREIGIAQQAKAPLSSVKANLSSLESAMKILKMAREERFAVLGVEEAGSATSDETTLPELIVSELSSEQIEEMRNRQPVDDGDDDEQVIIDGPNNVILSDIEDVPEDEDDE